MRLGPALAAVALAVAAALALATAAAAAEGVELIEDQGPPGFKELPFPPEEGPAEDPGEAVRAWTDKCVWGQGLLLQLAAAATPPAEPRHQPGWTLFSAALLRPASLHPDSCRSRRSSRRGGLRT